MADRSPEMLKPTLIAGGIFGAFAGLPYIEFLNCCTCCGFVWGCGLIASFLYSRRCKESGVAFGPGNGALVGLVSALFYAMVATVVSLMATMVFGSGPDVWLMETLKGFMEGMLESGGDVNEQQAQQIEDGLRQLEDAIERTREGKGFTAAGVILGFFGSLLAGAIFATLGGLIGGLIFKNEPAPPAGSSMGSSGSLGSESMGSSLNPPDPRDP